MKKVQIGKENTIMKMYLSFRAVDEDPHGSAFIFPPGTGFRMEKLEEKN